MKVIVLLILLSVAWAQSAEPTLSISASNESRTFSRSELLAKKTLRQIEVRADPTYPGQTMHYWGLPVSELFKGIKIPDESVIVFKCTDGYSAPISKERLLNTKPTEAIAFLAIEKPDEKWPAIKSGDTKTPAPFYVVWLNPEKSSIGPEEWPFMLSSFEVKGSMFETFPLIAPSPNVSEKIGRGFKQFTKNCFVCHTLNGQGTSSMGPDLNIPFSPTEYFNEKYFKVLVRNPQNLRRWPQSKMPGFSPKVISDSELDDLFSYLRHKASNRK